MDVYIRKLSVDALGKLKDPDAVDGLLKSLNDNESTVRWRAVRALGNIGDKRAYKIFRKF